MTSEITEWRLQSSLLHQLCLRRWSLWDSSGYRQLVLLIWGLTVIHAYVGPANHTHQWRQIMIFIDIPIAAIGACASNVYQALLSKGLGTRLVNSQPMYIISLVKGRHVAGTSGPKAETTCSFSAMATNCKLNECKQWVHGRFKPQKHCRTKANFR